MDIHGIVYTTVIVLARMGKFIRALKGLKRYFYYVYRKMDNFGQVAVKIVNSVLICVYIVGQGPPGPIQRCACFPRTLYRIYK